MDKYKKILIIRLVIMCLLAVLTLGIFVLIRLYKYTGLDMMYYKPLCNLESEFQFVTLLTVCIIEVLTYKEKKLNNPIDKTE